MVKIISDSTCDLSQELLRKYEIDILPLHILLGDKEYEDGKNITPDQIYAWSDANKTIPKTSAPALADAMELFRPYAEAGREIVCFSISAGMSTSGNVMRLAAEELGASDRIKVIDSANLSTGIGLLVVEAAIMAKNNRTASQIVSEIEKLKPNVRASFVVDTLTYLYRGGRCNAVAAMAGGVLKLHPRIVVEDGAMNASKKYRGKIASVVMNYVKDMEKDLKKSFKDYNNYQGIKFNISKDKSTITASVKADNNKMNKESKKIINFNEKQTYKKIKEKLKKENYKCR